MTLLAVATALHLLVAIIVFAMRRPGYSHVRDTISELGERGARDEFLVTLGVFLPVGLALGAIAFATRHTQPEVALLAGGLAVGYGVGAIFTCDPGSPTTGSWRQGIHNLAGGFEYLAGVAALWRLSTVHGALFQALAGCVVLAMIVLSIPPLHWWRGLFQRIAEVALFIGLAFALKR